MLSQGYFPAVYAGLTRITDWWMGVVAVLGPFLSIVLHELAYSVVVTPGSDADKARRVTRCFSTDYRDEKIDRINRNQ